MRETGSGVSEITGKHIGQSVLICGHSNTIPRLLGELDVAIKEKLLTDYDDLFVVTVSPAGEAGMLHLHYGARSP